MSPPQDLLVEYDYTRASHTSTHQEARGVHATLSETVNMAGIGSTQPRGKISLPKQWTDARPEDILLTQSKQLGASLSEITAKWNEMSGLRRTERGISNRRKKILRSIGQPHQNLVDMVARAYWPRGKCF